MMMMAMALVMDCHGDSYLCLCATAAPALYLLIIIYVAGRDFIAM
jgi:hypothetical protein